MHELKLFVTGHSPASIQAIENLSRVADAVLGGGYRLEIVDVLRQPAAATAAGVFCTPMLVKTRPAPEAWLLGDLADETRLARVLLPEAPDSASVVPVGGKLVRARELAAAHPGAGEAASAPPPAAARSKRIVLIDDYEGIHDSFRVALDGVPVDLISAYTGDLGVEAVRACRPDLVYLDLKMPGKDGVSTLRDIRARDTHTPIIVMTAFAEEFTFPLTSADRDGAYFELLAKPLDINEIHLVSAVATGGFTPRPS